jgi:hypothetical protein
MWRIEATDARCERPILIDSGCLAAINRYTALRPNLSTSVASAAVAMSGSMIMFLSCLVRLPRRRGLRLPLRLLSRSGVVPGCSSAPADAAAFCSVVGVVSPAWSFWRWILWAGDLKGLE